MPKLPSSPPGIKRLNVNLDEQLHADFKAAVATQKTDMGKVLTEYIKKYVRRHRPSALPAPPASL